MFIIFKRPACLPSSLSFQTDPHQYYDESSEHITLSCDSSGPYSEFPLEQGYACESRSSHFTLAVPFA